MTGTRTAAGRVAQIARAIGWLGLLAVGHLGLSAAGTVLPTPPPPWQPDALVTWFETHDIAHTSFSVLRLVGLATIWYLAGLSVLVLVARVSGLRPLATLAHRLALPFARRIINQALGAGLALTIAGGVVPVAGLGMAMASPSPIAAAIENPVRTDVGDSGVDMSLLDDSDGGVVVMERLPDDQSESGAVPVGRTLGRAAVDMHLEEKTTTTWTITAGDHLWQVAASTLESTWQRPPTDAEVTSYWQALVELNRDRLAVPDQPDLVYPGQVFELPPVSPGN
jgi:hypothetical protein